MGFMDKAKEAADDLRASLAGGDARVSEQQYRDLGMIAYLTATGRPIDEADRQRLINQLWSTEQAGRLPAFRLLTPPPAPPPPVPPVQAAPPPAAPAEPAAPAPPVPPVPAEPPAAAEPPVPAEPPAPAEPAEPPADEEKPPTA
jgi:hypothetical protein